MKLFRRHERSITTMPLPGGDEFGPIQIPIRPLPTDLLRQHPVALQERVELLSMKLDVAYGDLRNSERRNRKLQERLNRISNAMIGNARIWVLDRLAMESDMEANIIDQSCIENLASQNEDDIWSSDERADKHEQAKEFRADALFLRRFEFDLGVLHVAVRGDTNRCGGKYDQSNWKGPRP